MNFNDCLLFLKIILTTNRNHLYFFVCKILISISPKNISIISLCLNFCTKKEPWTPRFVQSLYSIRQKHQGWDTLKGILLPYFCYFSSSLYLTFLITPKPLFLLGLGMEMRGIEPLSEILFTVLLRA